ncbi:hypothetical protein scyTo_0022374, partial [Scyliorhinus torazame]|nr:hypothetical protein [Scyliorhinus torazame]
VDDGVDIPREMVVGIYERIQQKELKSNEDHVTYVTKVEKSIMGMKAKVERISIEIQYQELFHWKRESRDRYRLEVYQGAMNSEKLFPMVGKFANSDD